jgi:hypothetical protein
MPFLHWATSGRSFDERSALIETLSKEFKDPNYRRPSAQVIKLLEDEPEGKEFSKFKRRLIRAFLYPDQRNPARRTVTYMFEGLWISFTTALYLMRMQGRQIKWRISS